MLLRSSLRRVLIASFSLVILLIILAFPNNENKINKSKKENKVSYVKPYENSIYLIDTDEMVAKVNILYKSNNNINKVKEIIESLTIDSQKTNYIPNGFKAIIPKNTKLLNLSLKDNILKLNFNKNFLSISINNEEKMIESIVYSVTTIKDIKKVMIFVENEQLIYLPNSKKRLPLIFDRNYGINKVYDLDKINETTKTTVYYIKKNEDTTYYVPVTYVDNRNNDKIEIIIDELKSSSTTQMNLMSFLTSNTELLNYKKKENEINLSFNKYLLSDFKKKKMLEEVKYAISFSIKDNYEINKVNFYVEDSFIEECILQK